MNKTKVHAAQRKQVYIGLDIGKTKVAAGIVTNHGTILYRTQVPTEIEKGGGVILEQCRHLIRELLAGKFQPKCIGIGSSGVVNPEQGVIVSSGSIKGWCNIRVKDLFEHEFKIPVKVDNDVNVAALGEHFFGAGRGVNTSVFMVISTGVGFCIIKDGKIWRGSHNLAGQIAHLPLFSKKRTVNEMFSGKGISEKASGILGGNFSTEDVFELASKGNAKAEQIIEEAIESAALSIAWIQNTIDPDIFIIGGGVALSEKNFTQEIRLRAEQILEKYKAQLPKGLNIKLSQLGSDAGLIGCVALFINRKQISSSSLR
jgi:glucokinase